MGLRLTTIPLQNEKRGDYMRKPEEKVTEPEEKVTEMDKI
jgi:hypothetical protein